MRAVAALALLMVAVPLEAQRRVVDGFERASEWTAAPGEGVSLAIGSGSGRTGRALRLDFDFHGRAGYAVARRNVELELPENYELSFWIRGPAPSNTLEFKLIDSTGANVWWSVRRDFAPAAQWTRIVIPRRHVSFAWGPAGGGVLRKAAAIEIAITAGTGGAGTVLLDELVVESREPVREYTSHPTAAALNSASESSAGAAVDGDTATSWRSRPGAARPTVTIDFGQVRVLGGVVLHWEPERAAHRADVSVSSDGAVWTPLDSVWLGGPRDYVRLPEAEARHLRIAFGDVPAGGVALREVTVEPASWSGSPVPLLNAIAAAAPRGHYPRYLLGEQSYWTVVGSSDDSSEALVSEDGAVETMPGGPSLEPLLVTGGRLLTWGNAAIRHSLAEGSLPIPSVQLTWDKVSLQVTAAASATGRPAPVAVRYRIRNFGAAQLNADLHLALRPFQVNPSWQFLGRPGGPAPVGRVEFAGQELRVDGAALVLPQVVPPRVEVAPFGSGDVLRRIAGAATREDGASNEDSLVSASMVFPVSLAPADSADVVVLLPLGDAGRRRTTSAQSRTAGATIEPLVATWSSHLAGVRLTGPALVDTLARAIRSSLGYILVNRDGAAIQPGSRAYARSWIRDGALTSTALLRLGRFAEVRAFIDWFVPFQYPSGRAPCCVDRRGADPVPEHDSTGELIYLIAEYVRMSRDTATARRLWPAVERGAQFLDSLRHQRLTPVYRSRDSLIFYGLLPPSISHEGYSARPVHSYWDDFFALRGFKDAAWLAHAAGRPADAGRWNRVADAFRRDFFASIALVRERKGLAHIPGSADLADFDATSTTIALDPVGEGAGLGAALRETFLRYHGEALARRDTTRGWDAYTPYEWRNVGALVRLGERERALSLLRLLLADRRPLEWNQWGEVVWRNRRIDRFIGDMPHTWVASDFVRSTLDLFEYERASDSSIVLLSGVPPEWLVAPGIRLSGVHTTSGELSLVASEAPDGRAVMVSAAVDGPLPPGGFVIDLPRREQVREVRVNGRVVRIDREGVVRVHSRRAEVRLRY